jgi:hypothetical protein
MSETALDITISNTPLNISLIESNYSMQLTTQPAEVIQKGEWGKIGGDIAKQPDLEGYINKVVDNKMNGIKILTVTNEGN